MTERITVVGSINLDLVVTAPTLPGPGETVLGDSFTTVPGGKGANQAVAAARAGARCAFIGAVGQDDFAVPLRDNLVRAGIDLDGLRTVPGPSGVAFIAVDRAAENLIVVAPGANATLSALTESDLAAVAAADVLLCQLETPLSAVGQAMAAARTAGTAVILNAAPARPLPRGFLADVDLLVVNQGEAVTLAGRAGTPPELLQVLLDLVPRAVLTLGPRGAAYADRSGVRLQVPAPRIDAVDTTAAGDAFTGALAVAWARLRPGEPRADPGAIEQALRWACAAGAVCAQRFGASTSLPTRAEIDALADAAYRPVPGEGFQ